MSQTDINFNEDTYYHPDEYIPEDGYREPNKTESTLVTIAMFVGVVAFALGCTVLGWWN